MKVKQTSAQRQKFLPRNKWINECANPKGFQSNPRERAEFGRESFWAAAARDHQSPQTEKQISKPASKQMNQ
jgi:hypothetical protein